VERAMTIKITLIALVLLGIIGGTIGAIGTKRNSSNLSKSQEEFPKGSLLWYVQQAKAQGQKEITIGPTTVEYGGSSNTTTLDKVLHLYNGIISTPIKRMTLPYAGEEIVTWYKFKTVEVLSKTSEAMLTEENSVLPPEQLLPIADDEFVIAEYGGSLVMNGIKLVKPFEYPPFEISKQYLMFIRRSPSGKGEIVGGPIGAFNISNDGNIAPISNMQHPLIKTLNNTYNNSLNGIREGLAFKATQR
jgi:hypothetical protein